MLSPGSWVPRMIRDSKGLVDEEFLNHYGANTTDGLHKRKDWDGDEMTDGGGPRKK
ncbi:hypothetical protein PQX77_017173 [Marasmius sp. AFHP31]|nr:hypothetical protein PQX77_017173 [Marasmius sp. AFHP31]